MGKKKKNKKGAKKEKKTKVGVDDRAKAATQLNPPDENPFKMENENKIDRFLRFRRPVKDDKLPIRKKLREKH